MPDKPIYPGAHDAFEQGTVGPAPRRTVSDVKIAAVVAGRAQMSTLTPAEREIACERIDAALEARTAAARFDEQASQEAVVAFRGDYSCDVDSTGIQSRAAVLAPPEVHEGSHARHRS